ncbi:MAG: T9SS type A sorting domain-containing protein [Phycisphaerae bacterium]|nr:T9SS type A sorting domain-containing protein [Saprospiraceae bacterium]
MSKKVLFSLVLLLFSGHLLSATSLPTNLVTNTHPCNCELDFPANLHATRIGTTTADIAWDSVPGANGYRVSVFQKVGNNYILLNETNHFFNTSMTVTGLIPGSAHRVTVAGMCLCTDSGGNWIVSPNASFIEFPAIILDLDIVQLSPMPGNAGIANCTTIVSGCCGYYFNYINGNRLWIKVRKGDICNIHPIRLVDPLTARLFKRTDQTSQCPTTLPTQNIGYQGPSIITQSGPSLDYAVIREEVSLVEILRIDAYGPPGGPVTHICITNNFPGTYSYDVYELGSFGFGPPNGGDRDAFSPSTDPHIYPTSPFAENLDVIDASPGDLPVKLQLFDLSGRLETTQQYGSGQSTYSLPTADLAPGLYILRVGSGGATQTYKVVKTQN